MVDLLEVIDTHLLAIVQMIVAVGLCELFIHELDVPDWFEGPFPRRSQEIDRRRPEQRAPAG